MGQSWATHWATYGPLMGHIWDIIECTNVFPHSSVPVPILLPRTPLTSRRRILHFRSARRSCSVSLCCRRCRTIDVVVCHVALVPLLVWYAVPLFIRGMCVRTLLSSSSLPLSRREGKDKKDPVWLFDYSIRVNDFGNP